MKLSEIKRLYSAHLEREDGSAMIAVSALKFLVKEAETLEKIKAEATELYNEEIDYTDFGERVSNIL